MKWSERSIGAAVYSQVFRNKHLVLLPNSYYTGYETDLLVVRNDLRLMDIEIKISRSDLKADQYKDKWSKQMYRSWVHTPPTMRVEWPAKIWKHYYLIPKDIWKDDLFAEISPKSGVLLIRDASWQEGVPLITIKRQAKPNNEAKAIPAEDVLNIARLCSARMWSAYEKIETIKNPATVGNGAG